MQRENLLAANAIGNTANSDRLIDSAMLTGNYSSLENLNTLTRTFLDAHMYTNRVANLNRRQLFLHVLAIQSLNKIHSFCPP